MRQERKKTGKGQFHDNNILTDAVTFDKSMGHIEGGGAMPVLF